MSDLDLDVGIPAHCCVASVDESGHCPYYSDGQCDAINGNPQVPDGRSPLCPLGPEAFSVVFLLQGRARWIHGTPPLAKNECLPVYLWNGELERIWIAEASEVGGRAMANHIDCEGGDWWNPDWWYCPIPDAPPLPDEARAMKSALQPEVVPEGGHCTCCLPTDSCCKSIACRNRGVDMTWTPEGWRKP